MATADIIQPALNTHVRPSKNTELTVCGLRFGDSFTVIPGVWAELTPLEARFHKVINLLPIIRPLSIIQLLILSPRHGGVTGLLTELITLFNL